MNYYICDKIIFIAHNKMFHVRGTYLVGFFNACDKTKQKQKPHIHTQNMKSKNLTENISKREKKCLR